MLGHELFAVPPEDFIAARTAMVAELKEAGNDDDAAAVKALRRPTVTAYAVNHLARSEAGGIQELFEVGRRLVAAQRQVLSGRSGAAAELREATDTRRQVVRKLTDAAIRAMAAEGRRADQLRDAIASTLEAASVDEALGERLLEGTLEREASPSAGLGDIEGLAVLAGGRQPKAASPASTPDPDAGKAAEREAREAAKAADAAERDAAKATEKAGRLRQAADGAEAAAREARDTARRLGDEARTARRRADRAARAAEAVRHRTR